MKYKASQVPRANPIRIPLQTIHPLLSSLFPIKPPMHSTQDELQQLLARQRALILQIVNKIVTIVFLAQFVVELLELFLDTLLGETNRQHQHQVIWTRGEMFWHRGNLHPHYRLGRTLHPAGHARR